MRFQKSKILDGMDEKSVCSVFFCAKRKKVRKIVQFNGLTGGEIKSIIVIVGEKLLSAF